jgi:hypothetical protein
VLPQEQQLIGHGSAFGYRVPQWEQQEFLSNMLVPFVKKYPRE